MPRAVYQYTLTILEKVSFDPKLFIKELKKAETSLLPHEKLELRIWLKNFLAQKPVLKKYLSQQYIENDLTI